MRQGPTCVCTAIPGIAPACSDALRLGPCFRRPKRNSDEHCITASFSQGRIHGSLRHHSPDVARWESKNCHRGRGAWGGPGGVGTIGFEIVTSRTREKILPATNLPSAFDPHSGFDPGFEVREGWKDNWILPVTVAQCIRGEGETKQDEKKEGRVGKSGREMAAASAFADCG